MKTEFNSKQYGISDSDIKNFFSQDETIENELIELYDISLSPAGHGHYNIIALWLIDGKEKRIVRKTDNMLLVDAWKDGEFDLDSGYYDNWEDVVEAMISLINPEECF